MQEQSQGSSGLKIGLIIVVVLLVLCVCAAVIIGAVVYFGGTGLSFNSGQPPEVIEEFVTPSYLEPTEAVPPTEAVQQGPEILFEDDFSDSGSGWDIVTGDDETNVNYTADGKYLMEVRTTQLRTWANPYKDFTDVRIEVEATNNGPDNNAFGIICRYVDTQNYYFLTAASDGYMGIGKVVNGESELLSSDALEKTDTVASGHFTNTLRADCVGSTLTLYINGQMAASVEDSTFTSGDIGLMLSSFEEANVSMLYDNLVVYKP